MPRLTEQEQQEIIRFVETDKPPFNNSSVIS
jgi:hypothetical protein